MSLTTRSVSASPIARSSRSVGVAIITVQGAPLMPISTGVSTAMPHVSSTPADVTRRSISGCRGGESAILPNGFVGRAHFDGGDLVFGTVRCPVGVFRGDDVGGGARMVKRRVDHPFRDAIGYLCGQRGRPFAAR